MIRTACKNNFHNILIMDSDAQSNRIILELCASRGFCGTVAVNKSTAQRYLEQKRWDLVFMDLDFDVVTDPVCSLNLMHQIRNEYPELPIFVSGCENSASKAVTAIRKGCTEFIVRPINKTDIENLFDCYLPTHKTNVIASVENDSRKLQKMVGSAESIVQTVTLARKAAPTSAAIMITGQSGTGKELLAQLIHTESKRYNGPLVKINCAALNESLLESELFGHEKGAFTGAFGQRKGRFELANGGTLMLDEITETPESFQSKLLRILEEMSFQRVGGSENINVNVRIISTTNKNILEEVNKKRFRSDLYYRLSTIRLQLPPLKDRKEDIPQLIWLFINQFAHETGRKITAIDSEMLELFNNYSWPGNIRQLRNTIRAALIFGSGEVLNLDETPWLVEEIRYENGSCRSGTFSGDKSLSDIEQAAIVATLNRTNGNQTKAAKVLGISGRTLRDKIKKYRQNGEQINLLVPSLNR